MKKFLFIALVAGILMSCEKDKEKVYPAFILAGQTAGSGIQYTDLMTDDTLLESKIKLIDINQDGVDDFELYSYNFEQPGFGSGQKYIKPLNLNEIAAPFSDSTCVDTLCTSDTINKNLNWHHSAYDLTSYSYGNDSYTAHGIWGWDMVPEDNYVGVKLVVADKVIFGWIRLGVTRQIGQNYWLILDYGCTGGY